MKICSMKLTSDRQTNQIILFYFFIFSVGDTWVASERLWCCGGLGEKGENNSGIYARL